MTTVKTKYPLQLPASLKSAAAELAKQDGVSLNQWITAAVAQKIGAVQTAAEFFEIKTGKERGEDLVEFLDRAPDIEPEAWDQRD